MEMIETFLSERGAYVTEFLDKNVDLIIVGQKVAKNELSTRNSTSQSRVHQIIKATMGKAKRGSCSVEEIAKRWNIPLYDYKVLLKMCWLPRQKQVESSNAKISQVKKLKAPFIKVEDRSHRYRPEFVELESIPVIDFDVPLPQSPFETWYKKNVSACRKNVSLIPKTCELCFGTYTDLDTHLMSVRHTSAAKDDSLFAGIDSLIARGTTFKQFKENMEQRKNINN